MCSGGANAGRGLSLLSFGTFALLVFGSIGGARAAEVSVEADSISYENDGGRLAAEGSVRATWDDRLLEAGSLSFEQESGVLSARSGLSLSSPDMEFRASSARLMLDDETGSLENVEAWLKDNSAWFGGDRIEKTSDRNFSVKRGYYSTCERQEGVSPDWSISGSEIDVDLDGYARINNASFRVRGVPVLYLPYVALPSKLGRESGLLFPRIGTSNDRGFLYSQPFFWAIDKHRDATFSLDVETSARIGGTGEYRYRPSRKTTGLLNVEYFNESVRGDQESEIVSPELSDRQIPNDRGSIQGKHRQGLDSGLLLYADYMAVSDDLYFREVSPGGRTDLAQQLRDSRRYADSTAGVMGSAGYRSYGMSSSLYRDFYGPGGSRRFTAQRPIGAWLREDGAAGNGLYSFSATADYFRRRQGADGQRLDTVAGLEIPLLTGGALDVSSWMRGRLTGYSFDDRSTWRDGVEQPARRLSAQAIRGLGEAGVDARAVLVRDYSLQDGLMRHTLEPVARLAWTSGSHGELPLWDGVDRIEGKRVATLGLESRFLRADGPDDLPVERAMLALTQSYRLDEKVLGNHFSDLDFAVAVDPSSSLSFSGLASYNTGGNVLTGAVAAVDYSSSPLAALGGRQGRILAAYHFVRDGLADSLRTRASLGLSERTTLAVKLDYDFVSNKFLEKGMSLRFGGDCDCWAVDAGVSSTINPDELQFKLLVELSGLVDLGSSATHRDQALLGYLAGREDKGWRSSW